MTPIAAGGVSLLGQGRGLHKNPPLPKRGTAIGGRNGASCIECFFPSFSSFFFFIEPLRASLAGTADHARQRNGRGNVRDGSSSKFEHLRKLV